MSNHNIECHFDKFLVYLTYAGLGSVVQTPTEIKVPTEQHSRGKT